MRHTNHSGTPPVRFGAAVSLTGALSLQGNYVREGYDLFAKQINATGGILGRPVELILYDDQSDKTLVANLYEQLIVEDGVDFLLGPYGSEMTEVVAGITEKHQRVMIAPSATVGSIWAKGYHWLFKITCPLENAGAGILALAAQQGLKRVAFVHQDAMAPRAIAASAGAAISQSGLQSVYLKSYPDGTMDFSAVLNEIADTKPEVFIAAAVNLEELVNLTRQLRASDINPAIVACLPYGLLPEFQERLQNDAEGVMAATFWEKSLSTPGNAVFVNSYQTEYGRLPAVPAAVSYAGFDVLTQAINHTGDVNQKAVRDALLALKTQTIVGDYMVDETGLQIGQKAATIQWRDGKQVVVG